MSDRLIKTEKINDEIKNILKYINCEIELTHKRKLSKIIRYRKMENTMKKTT